MAACSSNDMQSICFYYYYYYFIIRDEFEFDDLKYCVLIYVLRSTIQTIKVYSISEKKSNQWSSIC